MDDTDEFALLAEQAADAGIDAELPRAERLRLDLADGRALSAVRYGTGSPEVTLVHGAGLNAHTWDTTVLALGLPALAIDLPGHGDSSWRDDADYRARTLAPDVASGIRAWTERPQLLVGHSLGGLTAAAVAANDPDLVRALVVVDITPGIDTSAGPQQLRDFFAGPTDFASRDELVDRAITFGLGGASRRAVERGVFFNTRVRPDGRVEWKHHFARLAATAGAATTPGRDALAAVLVESGWADLAAVTAPITLVRGEQGYVSEQDAATFAERVPEASLVVVRSGHNVQEQRPQELGRILAELARKG